MCVVLMNEVMNVEPKKKTVVKIRKSGNLFPTTP